MTRISRLHLVLVIAAVFALVSAPLASARPLATSGGFERTMDHWIGAAVRWVGDLVGSHRQASAPESRQKDGSGGRTPTNGSCLDPTGKPKGCL